MGVREKRSRGEGGGGCGGGVRDPSAPRRPRHFPGPAATPAASARCGALPRGGCGDADGVGMHVRTEGRTEGRADGWWRDGYVHRGGEAHSHLARPLFSIQRSSQTETVFAGCNAMRWALAPRVAALEIPSTRNSQVSPFQVLVHRIIRVTGVRKYQTAAAGPAASRHDFL